MLKWRKKKSSSAVPATAATFEATVRKLCEHFGYGKAAADWVVNDIKSRPVQFNHPRGQLPTGSEKPLAELFFQIVKIECELWAAKFR